MVWRGVAGAVLLGCAGADVGAIDERQAAEPGTPVTGVARAGLVRAKAPETRLPSCAGHATRWLRIAGNLSRAESITSWDPNNPAASASMSVTTTLYVTGGYPTDVTFYFSNVGGLFMYHALVGSPPIEVGSGALYFDADGMLQLTKVLQPLRLLGPEGLEAPLENPFGTPTSEGGSGYDGLTSSFSDLWSEIRAVEHDGSPRMVGYACVDGEADEDAGEDADEGAEEPSPGALVACEGHATRRVGIRGNLSAGAPIADAAAPGEEASGSVVTSFVAENDDRAQAAFDLSFTRRAERDWEYRVLLQSEATGPEVARGRLVFDAEGTLEQILVTRPFRFPDASGASGLPIELDFGTPTLEGGTGADGMTAFRMGSFIHSVEHDGTAPAMATVCPMDEARLAAPMFAPPFDASRYAWGWQPVPACAGSMTTRGSVGLLFDRRLPVSRGAWDPGAPPGPSELAATIVVFDSRLRETPVQARTRRISEESWEVHLLTHEGTTAVERASARVDGTGDLLAHVEGNLRFSLPLADGRDGPTIDFALPMALDQGVPTLLAIPGNSWLSLWANGAPADDCAVP